LTSFCGTKDVDAPVSRRALALIFWPISDGTIIWHVISKVEEVGQIVSLMVEGKGIDSTHRSLDIGRINLTGGIAGVFWLTGENDAAAVET